MQNQDPLKRVPGFCRDWQIILYSFAALTALLAAGGGWLFFNQEKLKPPLAPAPEQTSSLASERALLEKIAEEFRQKEAAFRRYQESPPEITDPSS